MYSRRLIASTAMLICMPRLALAQAQQPAQTQVPASDSASGIEDIVVTAQKRAERLQGVPIAITALNAKSLEQQGIHSLADFSHLPAPGLTVTDQIGSPVVAFTMRGISTSDVQQGTVEQGVALYIDGVYIPRSQGLLGDLVDVDRVEVLRGPQGTLFGRNAEGGAISIVSKGPTGKFGGQIGGEIGSYGERRGFIHLNLPEFANISIKLDGYKQVLDGYTKNPRGAGLDPNDYENFGHQNNAGGRVQVKWTPSSQFSAVLSADYSLLHNSPQFTYNINPTIINPQPDGDFYRTAPFPYYNTDYRTKVSGQSLVLSYEVGDHVTIKSITARRSVDDTGGQDLNFIEVFPIDALGDQLGGVVSSSHVKSDTFSQELQLIGTAGEFQYTAGAFYFRENVLDALRNDASIYIPAGGAPFNVPLTPLGAPGTDGVTSQNVLTQAFAIYGQATWAPSSLKGFKITLGGRYTEDRKSAERTEYSGVNLNPSLRPADSRANRFDPALTIAYQINRDVNVYARYAQAFRAGGVGVRSADFLTYGPESNRQVEIGLKSDLLDRHLRFNVAAFHSWVKDQQINESTDPNDPSIQNIINATGTTRIRGVEMEATVIPFQGLTLAGSLAFQGGDQPAYSCGGCVTERFVFLPKTTASLNGDYVKPLDKIGDLRFHVDWAYKSAFSTSPIAYAGQSFPYSHTNVWNGRVSLDDFAIGPVRATLSGFMNNIFDNREIIYNTDFIFQSRRPPRTYGASLAVNF